MAPRKGMMIKLRQGLTGWREREKHSKKLELYEQFMVYGSKKAIYTGNHKWVAIIKIRGRDGL